MRGKLLCVLTLALFGLSQPAPLLAQPAPVAATAPAATLEAQVRAVLAQGPQGTRFGLLVTTSDGTVVVSIDPDGRFIPASNTKLFTTAAALARLPQTVPGTGVRLEPHRGGAPDVVLVGRGDSRMSSAADCTADCLATLADAVAARTRWVGRVVGDATLFPDQRWSPGMSWNNIGTDSGTAIAALTLDDNELPITVTPTEPGKPPLVAVSPYLTVRNEAVTVASGERELRFETTVNGLELRIYGQIPVGATYQDRLGIDDPAHYTAWAFQRMLLARGVRIAKPPVSRYRPLGLGDDASYRPLSVIATQAATPDLATLLPAPLREDVTIINKVSQNLHAELLYRRIALLGGTGSLGDGALAVTAMLNEAGVPRTGYDFSDGSGMSSYNRVSPRATVGLLRWAQSQPWGAAWRATFPIGGVDGTLRRRFAGTPLVGHIWAKTGTLSATNALAGYLQAASGRELVFAIYANDVPDGANAVPTMDAVIELVAASN